MWIYASHGAIFFSSDYPERHLTAGVWGCFSYDADGSAEFAASDMKLYFPLNYCVAIASPGVAIFRYTKLND